MPAVLPHGGWGAIGVNGQRLLLTPWKRYSLEGLFPNAILIDGHPILAAPVTMHIQLLGGQLQQIAGSGSWTTVDPGRVVGSWTWSGASISLAATRRIDDDGLVAYTLTFTPSGAQRIQRLYLDIPLAAGLADYLLVWPHTQGTPNAAHAFAAGVFTAEHGSDSNAFPRSVVCHDGRRGLQLAIPSDKHCGAPAWGSTSRWTVTQAADTIRLDLIDGATPSGPSATPFDFELYLYPLPARRIVPVPLRWNRPDTTTLGVADYDTPAAEGAGTPYRWQGSAVKRGTGSQHDWDVKHAASSDQEVPVVPYTIANCWSDGDTLLPWAEDFQPDSGSEAWSQFLNPPNTQYVENGEGPPYSLVATDIANPAFVAAALARWTAALVDLKAAGMYFDVAQPTVNERSLDAWGRSYYRRPFIELREVMRTFYEICRLKNKIVMMHPQADFLPLVHTPSCDVWNPGEEKGTTIAAMGDIAARKRYYAATLTDYQKRAEWAPQVFAAQLTVLPRIYYSAVDALIDRNAAAGGEWLATESAYAEFLLHGGGVFHGFCDNTVARTINLAIAAAGLRQSREFRPWWSHLMPWATSTDPDARISGWRQSHTITLVVSNRSETSKDIPLRLYIEPTEAPTLVYAATGKSRAEGRLTAYPATISGARRNWSVGVALRGFSLVQFTVPRPGGDMIGPDRRRGTLPSISPTPEARVPGPGTDTTSVQ